MVWHEKSINLTKYLNYFRKFKWFEVVQKASFGLNFYQYYSRTLKRWPSFLTEKRVLASLKPSLISLRNMISQLNNLLRNKWLNNVLFIWFIEITRLSLAFFVCLISNNDSWADKKCDLFHLKDVSLETTNKLLSTTTEKILHCLFSWK